MYKFKFADIGEGLHEGTVGSIEVKLGDKVNEGDSLFVVETDKVTSEIPSPVTGVIKKILIKQGETVHVGDDTFYIDDGSADVPETEVKVEKKAKTEEAASVVGDIKVSNEVLKNNFVKPVGSKTGNNGLASPVARKIAKAKGIDISTINGSGPNGRVLIKDVENYSKPKVGSVVVNVNENFKASSTPVTGIRKAIARAMTSSWTNVAYSSLTNEVNMTPVWDQRAAIKDKFKKKYGFNLTFTALIAKATVIALQDFPILNSKFDESKNTIEHTGVVNLGIAVDTPKGLMVPVIKNAHLMSVDQIGQQIVDLATKAINGTIKPAEMSGGTFTLTNYGSAGAVSGVPVINYPEIGILGVGTIIDRVLGKNGGFINGKVMNLTCSFDHRWVDGGDSGRFITKIKEILENPILMGGINV